MKKRLETIKGQNKTTNLKKKSISQAPTELSMSDRLARLERMVEKIYKKVFPEEHNGIQPQSGHVDYEAFNHACLELHRGNKLPLKRYLDQGFIIPVSKKD